MESSHCSQSSPLHPVSLTKILHFPFPFPQINPSRSRSHILLFSNLKPSGSQRLPLSFSQNPHFFPYFVCLWSDCLRLSGLQFPVSTPLLCLLDSFISGQVCLLDSLLLYHVLLYKRGPSILYHFWVIWQLNNIELAIDLATGSKNLPGKHIIFC